MYNSYKLFPSKMNLFKIKKWIILKKITKYMRKRCYKDLWKITKVERQNQGRALAETHTL